MAEIAGKDCQIKISGVLTTMVGEGTTSVAGNLIYNITDEAKQVLDRTGAIKVQKKGTDDISEAGTTSTNITMTAHGLVTGDLICNLDRSSAYRLVAYVDDDNVAVASVAGQTTGNDIEVYKTEATADYLINRLNGRVTYPTATVRVIKISGNYYPMSVAAYAKSASDNKNCDILDITKFGNQYKNRLAGLKSASGTVEHINVIDDYFKDALTAGDPIVIEHRTASSNTPDRFWALLESTEMSAAVEGLQSETVSWISKNSWISLGE